MSELEAGTATAELVIDASGIEAQLNATFAQIGKLVSAQEKKIAESSGFEALGKQIEQFARATAQAEKQIQSLRFDAIADGVNSLVSAFKGAESGVQITEDLAKAESLLEERFALVRAEIQRQAEAQRGLVDEETLLERTTLQLEAAQRQHDAALATVRGRALQAAEGLAQLEAEEQASAVAAQKAWEAVGKLAIEQQQAEQDARALAEQEARTAAGLANLGTVITLVAEKEAKATTFAGELGAAHSALTLSFGRVASAIITVNQGLQLAEQVVRAAERAFDALVGQSVEVGDAMNRAKQSFALSADTLSGLRQAASDVDLSFDDVRTSLKAFTDLLANAAGGSKEAEVRVAALGINIEKLRDGTLSTDDAFRLAIDKLSKMEDGFNKSALQADAFGRSGTRMGEAVRGGAAGLDAATKAAREMGNAFDDVALDNAARLDDQLDELKNRTAGLANTIGKNLTPASIDAAKAVNEWIARNDELIVQRVQDTVDAITASFKGARSAVDLVESALAQLHRSVDAFLPSGVRLSDIVATLVRGVPGMQQFGVAAVSLAKFSQESQLAAMRGVALTATLDGYSKAVQATENPSKELLDQTARIAAEIKELSAKYPEVGRAIADYRARQAEAAKATGEASDAAREHAPNLAKEGDAAKKAADANKQLQQSIDQLKLDAVADDLDDAMKAMERSRTVVADESYLRALKDIEAAYNAQVEAAKRAAEEQIQAGADRTLAAEEEALKVAQAQREMAGAVEALNQPLQKNAEFWGDLGGQLAELPPALSVISPQFAALGVATGHASLATFGLADATREVSPAAEVASGTISDLSKAVVGLLDNTSDAGDVLQAFAGGLVDNLGGAVTKALTSSQFGQDLTSSLSGVFGPALGSAIATAGMSAVVQIGAGIFMSGVKDAMEGEAMSSAAKIGLVVGGPIGAAIGVGIVAAFGIGQQSMVEQIASQLGEMFKASFKADAVVQAINDGLVEVGSFLGPGLELLMIRAPKDMGAQVTEAWKKLGTDSSHQFSDGFYQDMKEKGKQLIHSSIADVLHVLFPQISKDLEVGIQQSAVAAGSAIAKEMGLLGDKAIKFANQWGIAFIGMAQKAGLSADEILTALHRIDTSLGTSQELVASLQRLQAVMIESGVDMDALFSKINEQLRTITGKKVKVGNLDEVLAAVGGDATRALGVIENAMEMAGISIEKFTGQLSDVVLAISGDAGTAIKEAGEDFRRFGNEADGTAGILRDKVLTALDNVIATAEELGYSAESIDAFKTAVGLIPPEMLRSSEFVNALRDDFARMAAESHMSVQELVDSIDPPLPEATRNAILAVNDLGKAIGDLTGAPLKSLKEVTDRMKQFGSEMYREVKDADGKVIRELTAFGQELIDEASTAISGMWDQMNEDGWVGLDEVGKMFEQLALLPVEALSDPAIDQAVRELLAKIGAMTGDAAIIAMANAEVITQDMINQGLAAYEDYKKTIEDNPPEVPPPTTPDGQPTTGPDGQPTGPDTTPASTAPPPAPIPPETLKSWEEINAAATAYATAVLAGHDAVAALSADAVAAVARIIGEPGDGQSFAALEKKLSDIETFTRTALTESMKIWSGDAAIFLSTVFERAVNVNSALDDVENTRTIHIDMSQLDEALSKLGSLGGTFTPGGGGDTPKSHTGELIPGTPGTESLRIVEAGEWIWPADLTEKLLSGSALALPASMASRVNRAAAVPAVRGGGAGGAVPGSIGGAAPGAPGFSATIYTKERLHAGAVVYIEEEHGAGRVHFRDAKGRPVKMSVDAHVRGKARAR